MKITYLILVFTIFLCSTCSAMTGTVIDAETGKPIEGAVVLVQWTVTKGLPGLTYGKTYKVEEVVTDNKGNLRINGTFNPFVNPPIIAVYKKGYVAWNNQYIFPLWRPRTDFKYENNAIIKLEKFKKEFSHNDHVSFISSAAISGSGGKLFDDAYSWERILAREELEKRQKTVIEKK
jgi:hypothetical protein